MIIDGIKIAESVLEDLKKQKKPEKFLAAVLVGESPASKSFLAQKKKVAELLGIDFRLYELEADISSDEVRKEVGRIANQSKCGGV
ncbi:MAG: tetrahydrofolate dehydrogenase/cyclohydrolase catalytic domain-containing protein, partial [Candidatus Liptonbacteria bacterium]|nr:tetrahydrofolate dehydrogenase/cyclohydrolase catalytic domain-containing protein [Candidatus Liptonbacteria bacterium]